MSRCFPFPPPGYEKNHNNKVSDQDSLIDSIKREEKERRKQKKREKKERKKLEKEKQLLNGEIEKKEKSRKEKKEKSEDAQLKRHSHKENSFLGDKKFISYLKKGDEAEQLERSGLSEEHGQQVSLPKLCDSSDSTQNSGKRKRHISSLDEGHNQKGSTMLRIRLPPLVKHKEPAELLNREQPSSSQGTEIGVGKMSGSGPSSIQSCSISERTQLPVRDSSKAAADNGFTKRRTQSCSVSGRTQVPLVKHKDPKELFNREQPCSSRGTEILVGKRSGVPNTGTVRSCSISERTQLPARDSSKATAGDCHTQRKTLSCTFSGKLEVPARDRAKAIADDCPTQRKTLSCTFSGKMEVPSRDSSKATADDCPTRRKKLSCTFNGKAEVAARPADNGHCSVSGKTEVPAHPADNGFCSASGKTEVPSCNSSKAAAADADVEMKYSKSKSTPDVQLSLREVIENWVPPPMQLQHTESEDLDWLFSNRETKRCKISDVASCHEVSNSWPRARYLPEAEIYALPYTVPF